MVNSKKTSSWKPNPLTTATTSIVPLSPKTCRTSGRLINVAPCVPGPVIIRLGSKHAGAEGERADWTRGEGPDVDYVALLLGAPHRCLRGPPRAWRSGSRPARWARWPPDFWLEVGRIAAADRRRTRMERHGARASCRRDYRGCLSQRHNEIWGQHIQFVSEMSTTSPQFSIASVYLG